MACGKHKDVNKRTQSDELLRDKAFEISSTLKYDGYQRGLSSMAYKFFDRNSDSFSDKSAKSSGVKSIKSIPNRQLADELHKLIVGKFKWRKVYYLFKDNILGVELTNEQIQ